MPRKHRHRWTRIHPDYPQEICRCGWLKVDEILVGRNTISCSPSGTDVMRWSASETSTSIGDIGMDTTTGRSQFNLSGTGNVAVAVEGDSTGTAYGLGYFGAGVDGTNTLSGNTTLAANEEVVQYTNLDLAGFELTNTTGDRGMVIHISGTLSGGGTIRGRVTSSTAGSQGSNSGGGGFSGGTIETAGYVNLLVNVVETGTYTISVPGGTGGAGGNGLSPTTTSNGSNGSSGNTQPVIAGEQNFSFTAATGGGGGQSSGTAGTAGVGAISTPAFMMKDMFKFMSGGGEGNAETDDNWRSYTALRGAAAGRGGANNGGAQAAGGGGGGGGGAWSDEVTFGGGGAGGAGLAGTSGTGGGGGAGAGCGGVVYVFAGWNNATSFTCATNGGAGGEGGDGFNANSGRGGGGGGASGGVSIYIGNSGEATVTASGGAGGAAGSGTGNGGSAGSTGQAGQAFNQTRT
jgi:hypothetical protein